MNKYKIIIIKDTNLKNDCGQFVRLDKNSYLINIDSNLDLYDKIVTLYHEFTHVVSSLILIDDNKVQPATGNAIGRPHSIDTLPELIGKAALKIFKKRIIKYK